MTDIVISGNFYTSTNTAPAPWSYNAIPHTAVGPGTTLIADLKDADNIATGISLTCEAALNNVFINTGTIVPIGGWAAEVFRHCVNDSSGDPWDIIFNNLEIGSTYILEVAGPYKGAASLDTDYTFGGVTIKYDNNGLINPPPAPVIFTGTVSTTSMALNIAQAAGGTRGWICGFRLTLTPAPPSSGSSKTNQLALSIGVGL